MNMKPHKDLVKTGLKNSGYAIRIGSKVPNNSANLAYVQSKAVSPEENILLEDVSSHIQENGLLNFIDTDYMVYPQADFLLETEAGQTDFPTDAINITDEFTVRKNRQDTPKPVFYTADMKGYFDARSAMVLPYVGGYASETEQQAMQMAEVAPINRDELLYIGDSIRIEANGGPLSPEDAYKVILIKEEGFTYRIRIMTNFKNKEGQTYKVIYPSYDSNFKMNTTKEEVLNAYPFFEQVTPDIFEQVVAEMEADPDTYKHLKIYTVKENENNFNIYATSDVMIANYQTRTPQEFEHRMEAKLKTKLSETNPGKLNIGFYFVDKGVSLESLASVGKVLNEHPLKPSYLELNNPHPVGDALQKKDILYWMVNLDMPEHHYEDYDVIIITGYGKKNMSTYHSKFEQFLKAGGVIWIDNGGSSFNVLDFKTSEGNTFVADIGFSASMNEFGVKEVVDANAYVNRLYPVSVTAEVGYAGVEPAILMGANEPSESWDYVLKHLNGGPSLMRKTVGDGKGTLLVSNCGLFRNLYHNREADMNINLIMNAMLYHAEEKWVFTPWRNEFVYHRENLFAREYKVNGSDVYINDRNDYNQNEIVAKKILANSCRDYVKSFCQPWFYEATGEYFHAINGDKVIAVTNSDFESGKQNEAGEPVTTWTVNTANAIPGWNTKKLAGQNVTYTHDIGFSKYGVRQVSIDSTDAEIGAQAFWESEAVYLAADDYGLSVWMSVEQVNAITTDGAKVGVFDATGNMIGASQALTGDKGWSELAFTFGVTRPQDVTLRIGFVDGNGFGKVHIDAIELRSAGTVRGVKTNAGEKPLYAFSVKPNPTTIDIEAEGFGTADITRIAPVIPFTYTITPFILEKFLYGFDELTGIELVRYGRKYGPAVSYPSTVRKTDGLKSLGYLHSILPPTPAGSDWSDRDKIFYRITQGSANEGENKLVNLKLFNRDTGMEWFYDSELIVGYMDIFNHTIRPSYVLHAETGFETIRASKRNFGLKLLDDRRIYTELPQTKDAKENWYLRIHNGRFAKGELGYNEWQALYANNDPTLVERYQSRFMKSEKYSIKEYAKQIFDPSVGIKSVENEVEYLTPKSVKIPHEQLYIAELDVTEQRLIQEGSTSEGTLFRGRGKNWLRNTVRVFIDELDEGSMVEIFEAFTFEVNYEEGTVYFPGNTITGSVYATYSYSNFNLYKRNYRNFRNTNDLLFNKTFNSGTGETTLYGRKTNWLLQPAPILKTSPAKPTTANVIPVTEYRIDYENGTVVFKAEPSDAVFADYGYFESESLKVIDADRENGILFLEKPISFKDDLYAQYSYYDDFYEYKGFYNENLNRFIHLDLNPSVGHYSTLPVTTFSNDGQSAQYRNVPSAKLLNKIIHIYMVPESQGGHSVRHCFSKEEWRIVQLSNPMSLLLSRVQVREHTSVNDVVVMDARKRGGGISDHLSVKAIDERVKGKQRYWDIGNWDGKAFYRNGVLIVALPKSILKEYGGSLNEDQVNEAIDKHVAYGTYCIIEWE